ncbi:MAG: hypothetical protein ACT4P1_14335 [Sporichthyaceae bacterium]
MRRRIGAGTATALLALATGAAWALSPHGNPAAAAGVTEFTATQFSRNVVDATPKGVSLGDRVLLSSALTGAGPSNGFSGVECVVTALRPTQVPKGAPRPKGKVVMTASSACVGTIETSAGLIAAQTLSESAYSGAVIEMVITGGSGDYEGAVGTLRLGTSTKTGSRVSLTLR